MGRANFAFSAFEEVRLTRILGSSYPSYLNLWSRYRREPKMIQYCSLVMHNQGRCGSFAGEDRFSRTAPVIGKEVHVAADTLPYVVMILLIFHVGQLR